MKATATFCFLALAVASCSAASLGFRGGVFSPSVDFPVFNVAWYKTCSAEMFPGPNGAWDAQSSLPAFPVEMVLNIANLPTVDQTEPYKSVSFNASLSGGDSFSLTFSGAVTGTANPTFVAPLLELTNLGPADAIDPDDMPVASFVLGQFNGLRFESAVFGSSGAFFQVKVDGFMWEIVDLNTIPVSAAATGYFQTCCQAPNPYNSNVTACAACNRACDDTCDMPVCP